MVFDFFCRAILKKCKRVHFFIKRHKAVCFCCGWEHYALSERGRCPICKKRLKTFLHRGK